MNAFERLCVVAGVGLSLWTLYAVWRNYRADTRDEPGVRTLRDGSRAYKFKYQRHPMDDAQYFEVVADSRAVAERLAINHMVLLFDKKVTIMDVCYPCYSANTR